MDAVEDCPQLHHKPRTLPRRTFPSASQQTVCRWSISVFKFKRSFISHTHTHTHTHISVNGHLLGEPTLAGCPLNYLYAVFLCPVTDILAMLAPVSVKFCMMVDMGSGWIFSPIFGGIVPSGPQIQNFGQTVNISKTVSHSITCQFELNISLTL